MVVAQLAQPRLTGITSVEDMHHLFAPAFGDGGQQLIRLSALVGSILASSCPPAKVSQFRHAAQASQHHAQPMSPWYKYLPSGWLIVTMLEPSEAFGFAGTYR